MNKIPELCRNCPNRSVIGQVLGLLSLKTISTERCDGYVSVAHGDVTYQQRAKGELAPPQRQWSYMTGGERENRYYQITWNTERICGQEVISIDEDEIPYGESEGYTDKRGRPVFAFISGDESALNDTVGIESMMHMLDSVDDQDDLKLS